MIIVPEDLVVDNLEGRVSDAAFRFYVIFSAVGPMGEAISQADIADLCQVSLRSAAQSIKSLRDNGWLVAEKVPISLALKYFICTKRHEVSSFHRKDL